MDPGQFLAHAPTTEQAKWFRGSELDEERGRQYEVPIGLVSRHGEQDLFARGIRRDQQAVTAGLSLPYSSASMEGNVNKIKLIKPQCYGRAGFPLLRKRVIHHPA